MGPASGVDPMELELVLNMLDANVELDLSQLLEEVHQSQTWSFCACPWALLRIGGCGGGVALDDINVLDLAVGVGQELPAWQNVLEVLTSGEESWMATVGVDVMEGCGGHTRRRVELWRAPPSLVHRTLRRTPFGLTGLPEGTCHGGVSQCSRPNLMTRQGIPRRG